MRTRCATGLRYSPKNQSQPSKLCLLLAPRTVQTPTMASVGAREYLESAAALAKHRAIARLGEMADQGDFDEFLGDKRAYR